MTLKDRQILFTNIVSKILDEPAQVNKKFDWFINKHTETHFDKHYQIIVKIFDSLNGDRNTNQIKRLASLNCDAYFGGKYNLIFEFDEYQHFSSARLKTFEHYPKDLKCNFQLTDWERLCHQYKNKADRYRQNKETVDFKFNGGRTAQQAYLDCFRDLLPEIHGLKPTLRISDLEVSDVSSNDLSNIKKVEKLLNKRLV